jgi:hypothetical protein
MVYADTVPQEVPGGQFALEQGFLIGPAANRTAGISAAGRAGNNVGSAARRSRSSARAPGWRGADWVEKLRAGSNPFPGSPLTRGAPPEPRVLRPRGAGTIFYVCDPGEYLGNQENTWGTRRIPGEPGEYLGNQENTWAGSGNYPQAPDAPAGLGFLRSYLASLIFLANPIFESSQMP